MSFAELAAQLAEVGRQCYARGWALGTSGNFSAVVNRDPLHLAITTSGVAKGTLSAEASLHLAIARARGAGAVLLRNPPRLLLLRPLRPLRPLSLTPLLSSPTCTG